MFANRHGNVRRVLADLADNFRSSLVVAHSRKFKRKGLSRRATSMIDRWYLSNVIEVATDEFQNIVD